MMTNNQCIWIDKTFLTKNIGDNLNFEKTASICVWNIVEKYHGFCKAEIALGRFWMKKAFDIFLFEAFLQMNIRFLQQLVTLAFFLTNLFRLHVFFLLISIYFDFYRITSAFSSLFNSLTPVISLFPLIIVLKLCQAPALTDSCYSLTWFMVRSVPKRFQRSMYMWKSFLFNFLSHWLNLDQNWLN